MSKLDEINIEGWGSLGPAETHKELIRHLTSALQRAQEGNHGAAMYHAEKAHMFARARHQYNQHQSGGHHEEGLPSLMRRQAESVNEDMTDDRVKSKFRRAMRRQQQKRDKKDE